MTNTVGQSWSLKNELLIAPRLFPPLFLMWRQQKQQYSLHLRNGMSFMHIPSSCSCIYQQVLKCDEWLITPKPGGSWQEVQGESVEDKESLCILYVWLQPACSPAQKHPQMRDWWTRPHRSAAGDFGSLSWVSDIRCRCASCPPYSRNGNRPWRRRAFLCRSYSMTALTK